MRDPKSGYAVSGFWVDFGDRLCGFVAIVKAIDEAGNRQPLTSFFAPLEKEARRQARAYVQKRTTEDREKAFWMEFG